MYVVGAQLPVEIKCGWFGKPLQSRSPEEGFSHSWRRPAGVPSSIAWRCLPTALQKNLRCAHQQGQQCPPENPAVAETKSGASVFE